MRHRLEQGDPTPFVVDGTIYTLIKTISAKQKKKNDIIVEQNPKVNNRRLIITIQIIIITSIISDHKKSDSLWLL
jgi:hypothetical protein